jgi:hypothetical protein
MESSAAGLAADAMLNSAIMEFEKAHSAEHQGKWRKENQEILRVLEGVEDYYNHRKLVDAQLGKAFFKLTTAQKNSMHKLSIEDMREDIEPTFTLNSSENKVEGKEDEQEHEQEEDDLESLSLINGLPTIELKVAQREFRKTLRLLLQLKQKADLLRPA